MRKSKITANGVAGKFGIFDLILYIFLFFFMISVLYPFWDLMMRSFSPPESSGQLGFALIPKKLTLASYRAVFVGGNIGTNYFNTIFRTAAGTVLGLFV
jgi:putative aldouronate transport system permease protein